jgi:putative ABC transport system ATP-binding protein
MELIRLEKIKPAVKVGMFGETSEIWGKEVTFQKGKSYLLRSKSGRGKTSAISFIYGLRDDFSGEVCFDNKSISTLNPLQISVIRREELSVVFQDLRLFRQLNAFENVLLKHQISSVVLPQEIHSMFDRLDIGKLKHKQVSTLSFGEQQRVAIIRSLVQPFDFLLMDEPFSHLDRENTEVSVQLILEAVKRRNASLILTSLGDSYGVPFDQIIEV